MEGPLETANGRNYWFECAIDLLQGMTISPAFFSTVEFVDFIPLRSTRNCLRFGATAIGSLMRSNVRCLLRSRSVDLPGRRQRSCNPPKRSTGMMIVWFDARRCGSLDCPGNVMDNDNKSLSLSVDCEVQTRSLPQPFRDGFLVSYLNTAEKRCLQVRHKVKRRKRVLGNT